MTAAGHPDQKCFSERKQYRSAGRQCHSKKQHSQIRLEPGMQGICFGLRER